MENILVGIMTCVFKTMFFLKSGFELSKSVKKHILLHFSGVFVRQYNKQKALLSRSRLLPWGG